MRKFNLFQMMIAPTERMCLNMGLAYAGSTYYLWDVYFQMWDELLKLLNYSEQELLNDIDKNWDLTNEKVNKYATN